MTTMSLVDLVNLAYPGQIEQNNIGFVVELNEIISISTWSVPGVERPTIDELKAMIPSFERQYKLYYFVEMGRLQIMRHLDSVAQQRQYDSAISCASYINSVVNQWKVEAEAFIAWRDSIFIYTLSQIALMQEGNRDVPSFEEFQSELPLITWP